MLEGKRERGRLVSNIWISVLSDILMLADIILLTKKSSILHSNICNVFFAYDETCLIKCDVFPADVFPALIENETIC